MKIACAAVAIALSISVLAIGLGEEPSGVSEKVPAATAPVRQSRDAARRQAELLHGAMHATLQVVHHQYYRQGEGLPLPAAVLKDVFAELEKDQQVKLRWLAVDGQAMNTDHEPHDQFEQDAVKALKSGTQAYERSERGLYRRAGSITLTNHCLKCHVPNRKSLENRTAGLIITIPINEN